MIREYQEVGERHLTIVVEVSLLKADARTAEMLRQDQEVRESHFSIAVNVGTVRFSWQGPELTAVHSVVSGEEQLVTDDGKTMRS